MSDAFEFGAWLLWRLLNISACRVGPNPNSELGPAAEGDFIGVDVYLGLKNDQDTTHSLNCFPGQFKVR